ncbi:hypothetical protein L1987_25521 [Smallanthus sonchifolius]|uniref:Uncharacterized protein n=1 Tax=Smallanthus sonchifolius TaxID=185202 RepID=A0ACB9IMQ1_9ASTR|nr:hypothetical protein L1987_25521 [Smallanthus sonchifolius]
MSIQTILQDLKTIKKIRSLPITTHRIIAEAIISSATETTTTLPSLLSTLTPNTVKLILSDPSINTHKCVSLLNVISQNQPLVPFKIEIEHYATVICRAIKSRRIVSKMFNLMLKVYSDTAKFAEALETFSYMRNNGIEVYERTCFVYLIALMRSEQLGLCLSFFYKMMESGIHVSVYTLTVVVDGLCKNGEIKSARELVQEAMCKDVKPNVITFNTLIYACCRRWNFQELDLVLVLMEKGGVEFNLETYKFLIDGFLSGGKVGDAERMIMEMYDKDLNVEIHLWNSIVLKYCKLGKMESAFQVFDKMIERSVHPNAETYRITGEFDDAVGLLKTMEKKGLFGDVQLYNKVITGLCESNRSEEATTLLSFVVKCGATPEFFINLIKDPK